MNIKLSLCVLGAAVLAACSPQKDGETASEQVFACDAGAVKAAVADGIRADAAALLKTGAADADILGGGGYAPSEVNEALQALGMVLEDVRTVQGGEESANHLACEAVLRLKIDSAADARLQRSMADYRETGPNNAGSGDVQDEETAVLLTENGFKAEGGGVFARPLAYAVRQADNGKVLTEAETAPTAAALEKVLRFYLAHDKLGRAAADSKMQEASETARMQELDSLNQARLNDLIELAKQEQAQAQAELDALWQAMPETLRRNMQQEQVQWTRVRQSECAYQAKSEHTDALEQTLYALRCETEQTRVRTERLAQKQETAAASLLDEAKAKQLEADREIRRVWGSMPEDVKPHLEADYQAFRQGLAARCETAAGQLGGDAAQVARLQCEAAAVRQKADELRGFLPK